MDLSNKNILMIASRFYDYGPIIADRLTEKGASVYWINTSIKDVSYLMLTAYKYLGFLRTKISRSYFKAMLDKYAENPDYIFVVQGDMLDDYIMQCLRAKYPEAKFVLYQWDSSKLNTGAIHIVQYFDKVFTFDWEDAQEYGWEYRPLFYLEQTNKPYHSRKYDFSIIGAVHSRRIDILHMLKRICEDKGYTLFAHLFCSRLGYYKCKYLTKRDAFVHAKKDDVTHRELNLKDTYKVYADSRIVVDYTHPNQTGYTMRTIECVGNRCKLITNNKYIKLADFYSEDNIYIYDENQLDIPYDFIAKPYAECSSDTLLKYSLDAWLEDILN